MPRKNNHTIKTIFSRRMLVSFIMGFACGLPLLLTISLLQAWMKEEGVDLTYIGLMALVGLPYTVKFLWAPFLDRYTLPFLGRRKGWLLVVQTCLIFSVVALGSTDPGKNAWMVAFAALIVNLFSASQDIVVDAYRREDLADKELGLGSSLYVSGYRVGMLLASGGGLIMAQHLPFSVVYYIMAACMLPNVIATLLTVEPGTPHGTPRDLKEAVLEPLVEYFARKDALWILTFIVLYKVGDTMASSMTIPFYMDMGFSKDEIGAIGKIFGFWAIIGGGLVGGVLMLQLGINKSLWIFGVLQAISTAGFAILAQIGYSIPTLALVITFENFSGGMGTAAFVAFMASITNKKFTATQYALLTSLMGVPRVFASASTGYLAKNLGWENFFIFCTLIAIPGMLFLLKFAPWNTEKTA